MRDWIAHSRMTNPGRMAAAFTAMSADPASAVCAIQHLLIHGNAVEHYGLVVPEEFNRETLPVEERLAAIAADGCGPLIAPRPADRRALGTCRDYALLTCAAMRGQARPARLRCGFASYFRDPPWEDHWVCEVREGSDWRRVDAQLDAVQRERLEIDFDLLDVPSTKFIAANLAWRECREGSRNPNEFGHGYTRGLGFVFVNLIRDRLALCDNITSEWDSWRDAGAELEHLSDKILALGDELAERADEADPPSLVPWWRAGSTLR